MVFICFGFGFIFALVSTLTNFSMFISNYLNNTVNVNEFFIVSYDQNNKSLFGGWKELFIHELFFCSL